MNRRKFIENSCLSCIAIGLGSTLFQGCSNLKTVNAFEENGFLIVDKAEFTNKQTNEQIDKIIVSSNYVKSPILLIKTSTDTYEAYSLECTHKGVRLDVANDKLTCSAHGSKFDMQGKVIEGPAKRDLKRYSTDKTLSTIKIELQ